jgi:hypothetical protein
MSTDGECQMNTWFHHVYLDRLFDRMLHTGLTPKQLAEPISTARFEIGFPARSNNPVIDKFRTFFKLNAVTGMVEKGPSIQCDDSIIKQFTQLIKTPRTPAGTSFSDLKVYVECWLEDHIKGPGTYDPSALDAFFATRSNDNSWLHLDAVIEHMCGSTFSEIIAGTEVMYDPQDPGLHGDVCFSLGLELASLELTDFHQYSPLRAMASSLDLLIPLVIEDVAQKGRQSKYNHERSNDPADGAHEKKVERSSPALVYIYKNGELVLDVKVNGWAEETPVYNVAWEKAFIHLNDKSILKSLSKAVPGSVASKLKGRFLEDGLGL